jgi:FkbH-like protein
MNYIKCVENALARYSVQQALFSEKPSRLSLMEIALETNCEKNILVNVWRNHNFEPLISLLQPYMRFSDYQANFQLSSYDNSFMFADWKEADIELIWLDNSHFVNKMNFGEWLKWLGQRLQALRNITTKPIILATWNDTNNSAEDIQILVDSLPAVYFANLQAACIEAEVCLLDHRLLTISGSSISSKAQIILARKLACHWLPASIFPPIKAIALDLDNTLHSGVLGEDGIQGVTLSQKHMELQKYILYLQRRGIFIALVSKNEIEDVEALFKERIDYPLRWEDFSVHKVSWQDKSTAIQAIAEELRISTDAILFVDDNPGELADVVMQLPFLKTVFAHPDPTITKQAIHFYPGLWRWSIGNDDLKRINDLKANEERSKLADTVTDITEYRQSLKINLIFQHDPKDQLSRLADLCSKTNQFNLALRRFNLGDLAKKMDRDDACVASIQLIDRLSDSGVIAVIVAERKENNIMIEEICISCRAMGRQLEDTMIITAVKGMGIFSGCKTVSFQVQHGPRNQPALTWLSNLMKMGNTPESGVCTISAKFFQEFTTPQGITIKFTKRYK